MNKVKQQFIKDFEESNNKVDLTFDVSQLEPNVTNEMKIKNRKKVRNRIILSFTAIVCLAIVAIPLSQLLEIDTSFGTAKRTLSANAIAIAESNSFKKLNNVKYPESERPTFMDVSDNEMSAYTNFANATYHSLVNTSKVDNMSYGTIGLYSIMNDLYGAISREDLQNRFNDLLGLNENSRKDFYRKVIYANSYINKESSTQIKNAAFFNNKYMYADDYINKLTSLYCEAYQLDFNTNASKMVEWVNEAVDSKGFIDEKFLGVTDNTQLYLFSTLYFKNAWSNKFLSENNVKDKFYLSSGETEATYMCHSYMIDRYYDYGKYISVKDYYDSGFASVTYIIPKSVNDNIFELTKDVNIFSEQKNKEVRIKEDYSGYNGEIYYRDIKVNLKTPKFNNSSEIDFSSCLENLGFSDIYDNHYDSFHNAFDWASTDEIRFCLSTMKQKNQTEFNEDGAIIKSLSMASLDDKAAPISPNMDEIDVTLNQPFIYIIRDCNNVPIFVGHIDNPNL